MNHAKLLLMRVRRQKIPLNVLSVKFHMTVYLTLTVNAKAQMFDRNQIKEWIHSLVPACSIEDAVSTSYDSSS